MEPHACGRRWGHGIESVEGEHCSLAELVGRTIRNKDLSLLEEGAWVHSVERQQEWCVCRVHHCSSAEEFGAVEYAWRGR